ncbi:MAG: hypothetical protein EA371_13995 [Gammaproteobacteria bacterium]|nr:MAG: hypothetical protein EA371_13995 [Gammaproteobacteria bacterium]
MTIQDFIVGIAKYIDWVLYAVLALAFIIAMINETPEQARKRREMVREEEEERVDSMWEDSQELDDHIRRHYDDD